MNFADIINQNYQSFSGNAKLWCRFAFHFTDISNAVEILLSNTIYSRHMAIQANIMHNENASRQVIDFTNDVVQDYVRFYFRPLTPTQYYNEGFKHKDIRYDGNPNVPVPIFFVFDLSKLLSEEGVNFSEKSQAGNGCELCSSEDEFEKFDFAKIYSDGPMESSDIKKYRHAEILYPDSYNIDKSLVYIVCRNSLERESLCHTLRSQSRRCYEKYNQKIIVSTRDNMFYANGLFIDECSFDHNKLNIIFSDLYRRKRYAKNYMEKRNITSLDKVDEKIVIEWLGRNGGLKKLKMLGKIDYLETRYQNIKLPNVPNAQFVKVKIYFEDALMCNVLLSVEQEDIV